MNARRRLAYPEVKHPSASSIRSGTGPGSEHMRGGKKKKKKEKRKKKKESVWSLQRRRPPSCPHQRKKPRGAEDDTGRLGLVGSPAGKEATRSLAGRAEKVLSPAQPRLRRSGAREGSGCRSLVASGWSRGRQAKRGLQRTARASEMLPRVKGQSIQAIVAQPGCQGLEQSLDGPPGASKSGPGC